MTWFALNPTFDRSLAPGQVRSGCAVQHPVGHTVTRPPIVALGPPDPKGIYHGMREHILQPGWTCMFMCERGGNCGYF